MIMGGSSPDNSRTRRLAFEVHKELLRVGWRPYVNTFPSVSGSSNTKRTVAIRNRSMNSTVRPNDVDLAIKKPVTLGATVLDSLCANTPKP